MKSIFTSKTFILAVLQAVVGGFVAIDMSQPLPGILLILKSIIDVVFRYTTTTPVAFKAPEIQ